MATFAFIAPDGSTSMIAEVSLFELTRLLTLVRRMKRESRSREELRRIQHYNEQQNLLLAGNHF
jgi:hypothetical protein